MAKMRKNSYSPVVPGQGPARSGGYKWNYDYHLKGGIVDPDAQRAREIKEVPDVGVQPSVTKTDNR